jgi:hypothetical protein
MTSLSDCHQTTLGGLEANSSCSVQKPAEIMNPFFQAQSCDPFTSVNQTCTLGNYASYSINVTGADDVRAGLKFAQDNNVRLVIRNTGHE